MENARLAMVTHRKPVLQRAVTRRESVRVNLWVGESDTIILVPALQINNCEFATSCTKRVMREEGGDLVHVTLYCFRSEVAMTAVVVPLHESPINVFFTKENLSIDVDQNNFSKSLYLVTLVGKSFFYVY